MRIGVMNNLRAGRSEKQVARVLERLSGVRNVWHVETDSAGAVPEALDDLARHDVDLLVINGGDGTLQHTLTELLEGDSFERIPWVAPLRGGRTNSTAVDLGAQRDPVRGLDALLRAVEGGCVQHLVVERPVLRAAFEGGRRVEYGMIFGAGVIHRAIALVHRLFPQGRSQGAFGAGLVTMSLLAKAALRGRDEVLEPDKIQILLGDELLEDSEFHVAISTTLTRFFWRLHPFWGDGEGDVRFTCIASRAEHFARTAPGLVFGRPSARATPENGYVSRDVERARLGLSCGFTIDGEIFHQPGDDVVTLTADRRVTFLRA